MSYLEVSHKVEWAKIPTAIHGHLSLQYQPREKATAIADYLENQFTPHDLCDINLKRRMEAGVQAQPEAANNTLLVGKTP
jgi:hypothetical protein